MFSEMSVFEYWFIGGLLVLLAGSVRGLVWCMYNQQEKD